jgi:polyferredoxin
MKVSSVRVLFQILLHVVLIGHVVAYYWLDWKAVGALDFQAFFHHLLGRGVLTAGALLTVVMFLFAAVFGRLFCSWGCHFGATQDLAAWILRRCGWKPPLVRTRFLHHTPYALLVVIFLWPVVERWRTKGWGPLQVDFAALAPWETLPGWFLSVTTFLVCGLGVLLFLGTRGFCRFVCPYGAVFRLSDRVTPFRVRRVSPCATDCGSAGVHPCTAACPTAIDVHQETAEQGKVVDVDCVRCHLCIEACPSDALAYSARRSEVLEPQADSLVGGEVVEAQPGRTPFALPLWGECFVLTCAVLTYVCVDLVYGGHFLAATIALGEGFLGFVALRTLCPARTGQGLGDSVLGKPLRSGRGFTFVGITAVGAFALSLFPIFDAGAFKWLRGQGIHLDPGASEAVDREPYRTDKPGSAAVPAGLERQRLVEAARYYHRALGYAPAALDTRRLLVSAYVRLGDYPGALREAEELARRSSRQDPRPGELIIWLKKRLEQTGPKP